MDFSSYFIHGAILKVNLLGLLTCCDTSIEQVIIMANLCYLFAKPHILAVFHDQENRRIFADRVTEQFKVTHRLLITQSLFIKQSVSERKIE
ncbi:TPA: hypothetical protein I7747_14965 [Vibrio vulnificus]|nr:hypothetical protein [Vibrio vulnificus]